MLLSVSAFVAEHWAESKCGEEGQRRTNPLPYAPKPVTERTPLAEAFGAGKVEVRRREPAKDQLFTLCSEALAKEHPSSNS